MFNLLDQAAIVYEINTTIYFKKQTPSLKI